MDNNQTVPQAAPEKITQAQDLLQRANLISPASRLMCETVINSKSGPAIDEMILYLQQLIAEKEQAYQEFKVKMAESAKILLGK